MRMPTIAFHKQNLASSQLPCWDWQFVLSVVVLNMLNGVGYCIIITHRVLPPTPPSTSLYGTINPVCTLHCSCTYFVQT